MALIEQTILRAVTVRPDTSIIEVEWRHEIVRDDEVISSVPHRRAFSHLEQQDFEAAVDSPEPYITAVGWLN